MSPDVWIYGLSFSIHDRAMKSILEIAQRARDPEKPLRIRFIVGEERLPIRLCVKVPLAKFVVEGQVLEALCGRVIGK